MADTRDTNSNGTTNQSQQEAPQAQDIAEEALHRSDDPSEDSERGGSDGISVVPQDEQDLVDHMNQMVQSGHIDRSAFDGERNDDDEESPLGTLDDAESDSPGDGDVISFGNSG